MTHRHFAFAIGIFASALAAGACSSAPPADGPTGMAQSEISKLKCTGGMTVVCDVNGDQGDGFTKPKVTCWCEGGDAATTTTDAGPPAPPATPTIWDVTAAPHDTTAVHDFMSNDPHGPSAFVQPPELAAYGCTQTVIEYNADDLHFPGSIGGRVWACPADQRAAIVPRFTTDTPVSGSFCVARNVYVTGTSMNGYGLGDAISGWFFLGEQCWPKENIQLPGGMPCSGPCMIVN